ncbi:CoA transferase [Arthrobacter sp. 35W]|uniref:CoA transferase n=1 Tax=Arthrobacter sp. 35W TaxID=1132441 RepID=UPI000687DB34|nr:CoA transferase [Arthrobacter sp. 35W]
MNPRPSVPAASPADLLHRVGWDELADGCLESLENRDQLHLTAADRWARSGAQRLTAFQGRPPGDVAGRMSAAALALETITKHHARTIALDGAGLLGERAALSDGRYQPHPGRTLRGAGLMLRTIDGWIAANLPRDCDRMMIPALTDGDVAEGDITGLSHWTKTRRIEPVLERARLLGVALAEVSRPSRAPNLPVAPWSTSNLLRRAPRPFAETTVLDLSGLWAGPLAASLLGEAGASVVRLDSESRPAPNPPPDEEFDRLLNGRKENLRIDFDDRELLHATVAQADVVIMSSRRRAIENLGLRPRAGQLWLSITAHGNQGTAAERIGFGDDAAASAGAVFWHEGKPNYCGDALADPITGLLASVACAGLLARGVSGQIEISLAGASRWAIADVADSPAAGTEPASPPRARNRAWP